MNILLRSSTQAKRNREFLEEGSSENWMLTSSPRQKETWPSDRTLPTTRRLPTWRTPSICLRVSAESAKS